MLQTIHRRRSVHPKFFTAEPVQRAQIQLLLEAANAAPNHKLTQPWRFQVFAEAARERFSAWQSDFYAQHTPPEKYSELKHQKMRENPLRASAIVAIIAHISGQVPEVEEVCAVACAVQNMWLAATDLGLGAFWSTGGATFHPAAAAFLGLADNEQCLGFFYIGHHNMPDLPTHRGDIGEKTTWIRQ